MILSTLQVLIQYNLALLFFSRVSLLLSSCLMEKLFSHVARTVASVRLVSGLLNKIWLLRATMPQNRTSLWLKTKTSMSTNGPSWRKPLYSSIWWGALVDSRLHIARELDVCPVPNGSDTCIWIGTCCRGCVGAELRGLFDTQCSGFTETGIRLWGQSMGN